MIKSLAVLGCILSFVCATVLHYWAEAKSGIKSPILPESYNNLIDEEIQQLNTLKLIALGVGIVLLILSIKMISKKNESLADNVEILDE